MQLDLIELTKVHSTVQSSVSIYMVLSMLDSCRGISLIMQTISVHVHMLVRGGTTLFFN